MPGNVVSILWVYWIPELLECSPSWWVSSLYNQSPSSQIPFSMNFLEPSRNKTCNSSISYLKPKSNLFWQVNNVEDLDILSTCPFWQRGGRKKWEFFLIFLETATFLISFGNSKDFCFWKLYHEENAHWLKLNLYFFLFVLEYATENHGETCVVSETCRWNMQLRGHWR